jgi:hypothetical protein
MGDRRVVCRDLVGYLRERDHLDDLGVDGKNNIKIYRHEVG